jgi:hypothetical protein
MSLRPEVCEDGHGLNDDAMTMLVLAVLLGRICLPVHLNPNNSIDKTVYKWKAAAGNSAIGNGILFLIK